MTLHVQFVKFLIQQQNFNSTRSLAFSLAISSAISLLLMRLLLFGRLLLIGTSGCFPGRLFHNLLVAAPRLGRARKLRFRRAALVVRFFIIGVFHVLIFIPIVLLIIIKVGDVFELAAVLAPRVLLIVHLGLEVNIRRDLLAARRLHRHLVRQFETLKATGGTLLRAEVPRHEPKVRLVQYLRDVHPILHRHDLIIRVDVREMFSLQVNVRLVVLNFAGVDQLEAHSLVPVVVVVCDDRRRIWRPLEWSNGLSRC